MNLKQSLSKFTLQDWIFTVFSILWVGVIVLDYLNKQVIYIPSVTYFKYFNLFLFFGVLGFFLSAWYSKLWLFKRWPTLPVNGLAVLFILLLAVCAITFSYNKYWRAPLDYTNYLHLMGKGIFTLGCSFFLVLSAYSIGNLFRKRLIRHTAMDMTFGLLDICLGFVIYTFLMMLLGALAVLDQFTTIGVMVVLVLVNYRAALSFLKATLITPIRRPNNFTLWGGILAFFIIIYVALNYMYTQAPYPLGFDARNYYVNIPRLISEAGALIPGFQPYAWGLVMSTGYIAFNSPEVTLFISAMGGLLSLFAIYHFCHRYIDLSPNLSFAVVLLYLLTPTVTNHFIIEFKIDLSLVFFQIVIINFLLWWIFDKREGNISRTSLIDSKQDVYALSVIGILLGYCLSIKVLSVFLIFGIFLGMWSYHRDILGVIGLAAVSFGVILILKLDNLSGLRDYHLSPSTTGIVLTILGVLLLVVSFLRSRQYFLQSVKALAICGVACALTFSPWIYKNYTYKKSTSFINLIMGEKPRPDIRLRRVAPSDTNSNN